MVEVISFKKMQRPYTKFFKWLWVNTWTKHGKFDNTKTRIFCMVFKFMNHKLQVSIVYFWVWWMIIDSLKKSKGGYSSAKCSNVVCLHLPIMYLSLQKLFVEYIICRMMTVTAILSTSYFVYPKQPRYLKRFSLPQRGCYQTDPPCCDVSFS